MSNSIDGGYVSARSRETLERLARLQANSVAVMPFAFQGAAGQPALCFHCGNLCGRGQRWFKDDKEFCCQGCLTVFELLTHTSLSTREIAATLGFSDERHLIRHFRAVTGATPRAFRDAGR